ncbi:unnamed protein product, partial [marine sediment metagenome]
MTQDAAVRSLELDNDILLKILNNHPGDIDGAIKEVFSKSVSDTVFKTVLEGPERSEKTILDMESPEGAKREISETQRLKGITKSEERLLNLIEAQRRFEEAEKNNDYKRDNSGINPRDKNNEHFTVMREIARQHPGNSLNVLLRYWKTVLGVNNHQVQEHLRKYGINMSIDQINSGFSAITKNKTLWKKTAANLTTPATKTKTYSKKDIDKIWAQAVDRYGIINDITGIDSDIDNLTFKAGGKRDGFYIISINRGLDAERNKHGENIARTLHRAVADFIYKKVNDRNDDHYTKKTQTRILLKNPTFNESTDFVFTGENISKKELGETVTDIYNLLTKRYPDIEQNKDRAFVVLMDNKLKFDEIKNANISFTRDFEQLPLISDSHNYLRGLLNTLYPGSDFKDMLLNQEQSKTALNNLLRAAREGADKAEIDANVKEVVKKSSAINHSLPAVIQSDFYA